MNHHHVSDEASTANDHDPEDSFFRKGNKDIKVRFRHGHNEWSDRRITAREKAILKVIDNITDITDWHKLVCDKEITQQWELRARKDSSLMSDKTWKWIMDELHDKAEIYSKTHLTLTLNLEAGVCKSDELVGKDVAKGLREYTSRELKQLTEKDKSRRVLNGQQLNIVDPAMYPLMYGKTKRLEGEDVPLENCSDVSGKGRVLDPHDYEPLYWHKHAWSRNFQLLPFEVEFSEPGSTDIHITSYVNNLHPKYNEDIYGWLEKLISAAIEPLNEVVLERARKNGRTPSRILTYGASYIPEYPPSIEAGGWLTYCESDPDVRDTDCESDYELDHELSVDSAHKDHKRNREFVEEYLALDDNGPQDDFQQALGPQDQWIARYKLEAAVRYKHMFLRQLVHPEPGVSFTFQDWKNGNAGLAIEWSPEGPEHSFNRKLPYVHEYYTVKLQDTFREEGLQFIIRMSSIDLDSEHPTFTPASWNASGMDNDMVAATVLYFYDVSNVTPSRIAFRQNASITACELAGTWQDGPEAVEAGIARTFDIDADKISAEKEIQTIGSVKSQQGRLIAFPSALHYRMEPFELVDKTKPGHCRFVTLHLVDPYLRIYSTRDVPPQQLDWWAENGVDKLSSANSTLPFLPKEVVDKIADGVEGLIGKEEALESRDRYNEECERVMADFEQQLHYYDIRPEG